MEIQKNVPITDGRGMPRKYPWPDLHVGDSFTAPVHPDTLRASAWKYDQKFGTKMVVRKDVDGARAWRVR